MGAEEEQSSCFSDWCHVTTCGGIIDWYQATTLPRKGFWFLVVAVFLGLTFWQTGIGNLDYVTENKYSTSVFIETRPSVQFPNVTVCNFNRARKSKISNISFDALSYAFGSFAYVYSISSMFVNITEYELAWREFAKEDITFSNLERLIKNIGSNCQTTFLSCIWAGVPFNCCSHVTEVVNVYGNCFTITTPSPVQFIPGASEGLKLILDPRLSEYPTSSDFIVNNFPEAGFVVSISYIYEPSLPDPVTVPVGSHAWIALRAQQETIVQPQIQLYDLPCRTNPKLQLLQVPYTKSNCYVDCDSLSTLKACGCLLFSDFDHNYKLCNASTTVKCIESVYQLAKEISSCQQNCLNPCEDTSTVRSTVSITNFPSKKLVRAIGKIMQPLYTNISDDTVSTTVCLDIYFPRLEVIKVEKFETTSLITFISNIGGNLGFWLGVSLLTVIQTFYYIVEWLCSFCSKCKNRTDNREG